MNAHKLHFGCAFQESLKLSRRFKFVKTIHGYLTMHVCNSYVSFHKNWTFYYSDMHSNVNGVLHGPTMEIIIHVFMRPQHWNRSDVRDENPCSLTECQCQRSISQTLEPVLSTAIDINVNQIIFSDTFYCVLSNVVWQSWCWYCQQ